MPFCHCWKQKPALHTHTKAARKKKINRWVWDEPALRNCVGQSLSNDEVPSRIPSTSDTQSTILDLHRHNLEHFLLPYG
ncbi:hypothetical protein L204_103499 [Cryptococcus depauperatus]